MHEELLAGGELAFDMDEEPNPEWGVDEDFRPTSRIEDDEFLIVPSILRRQELLRTLC